MTAYRPVLLAALVALLAIAAAGLAGGERPSTLVTASATATAPSTAASTSTPPATSAATAPASATPIPPIPDGYRVQIARLGIDLPIAEGDIERDSVQQRTPENFAFHLPRTGLPGDGVNSYLYAHARRGMFLSLWNVRVGDEVLITTPDGRVLRYAVTEIHPRVAPTDVGWAAATPPHRLTLQTSTGPNSGDPRFVVVAMPQ